MGSRNIAIPQPAGIPGERDWEWSRLSIADISVKVPKSCQYRLDEPSLYTYGSAGGWLREGKELVFTVLWRKLGYWRGDRAPDFDRNQMTSETLVELHDEHVRRALHSMRRDSKRLAVVSNEISGRPGGGKHPTDVLSLNFSVRRRFRTITLERRQVLWTCPHTQRHLAFEISVLDGNSDALDGYWRQMAPSIGCHSEEDMNTLSIH